jgi:hypothetical protein
VLFLGGMSLTFDADGSTIVAYGPFTPYVGGTLALTGGTGKFAYGVGGEAKLAATKFSAGPYKGRGGLDITVCITN